jgi:mannose-6-phosphate isomerase
LSSDCDIPPPLYPLTFQPIFKERVWGGRNLERLYHKRLPPGVPIGESWEITDRPESASLVATGPLAGNDLRWLMEHHAKELLGSARSQHGRFPLLVKLLDAQEKLSLQVHPPADVAPRFGGEPKTEMWYIADARPGAELYAGLRRGVTRAEFERKIKEGSVADCFHRLPVKTGDVMFLPSGRVHAIGAGLVIFEIQQNSDTTFRVFDWNRPGLDGRPRPLHVEQSLQCIDFNDFEPSLAGTEIRSDEAGGIELRTLATDPLFSVSAIKVLRGEFFRLCGGNVEIIGALEGRLNVVHREGEILLAPGQFCLKPAAIEPLTLRFQPPVHFLHIQPG